MKGESIIYTTKEIANINDVHLNTVRLYEKWGYISKTERDKNNYRIFTESHLYQMKLARVALPGPYPIEGSIVHELVRKYACGDHAGSLKLAEEYSDRVDLEKKEAQKALVVLDNWFENKIGSKDKILFKTRKVAANYLRISIDTLRTWERNGLFNIRSIPVMIKF